MTSWDLLLAHTTLPSGTAWEHLEAQQGGGVIVNEGATALVNLEPYTLQVQSSGVRIEVQGPLVLFVDDSSLQLGAVDRPALVLSIPDTEFL